MFDVTPTIQAQAIWHVDDDAPGDPEAGDLPKERDNWAGINQDWMN